MVKLWLFLLLPSLASAYSWRFTSTLAQCQDTSIQIQGPGIPPYRVLIIPFGPSPLPNNVETRRINSQNFTGNNDKITWQLNYPANSQLVAVVSDASGFGSGGTSVAVLVAQGSNHASCFDANTNVQPPFVFNIEPPNQVVQCAPMRIWWDPTVVQGIPQFMGVIPGGQSFQIPVPTAAQLTTVPNQGLGFNWTPSVRGGTTLIVVAGDDRGPGSGGSALFSVAYGSNSCLNDYSPSSTPGSPAGGSYPTNAPTSSAGAHGPNTSSQNGGDNNSTVGAIIGGTVGGVTFLLAVLLAIVFYRRRHKGGGKVKTVDLLHDQEDDHHHNELPPFYQPAPFMVPESSTISRSSFDQQGRPISMATSTTDWGMGHFGRSTTPEAAFVGGVPVSGATSSSRKSANGPSVLRSVNFIQHDDAGPSEGPLGESETIELPPAYTNLKSAGSNADAAEETPLQRTPPP